MGINAHIPENQFRYYYTLLPGSEQNAYNDLVEGLTAFKNSIRCIGCDANRIQTIYQYLRLDIPELFYIKSVSVRYSPVIKGVCTVLPEYRFDMCTVENILQAMQAKADQLKPKLICKSELDKEVAIHNLLVSSVQYRDLEAPYSHEAPGGLLYGIGVCEGISKAFKYLADRVGLKSLVATGMGNDHGNEEGHAWNMCQIGNRWYHLDVTFDSTIADGCVRYDYFNLSDAEIATNHSWTDTFPNSGSGMNYYDMLGVYFDSQKKLGYYLRCQPKEVKTIVFQLPRFGCAQQPLIDAVRDTVKNNIRCGLFETRQFSISYNLNRMVFQVDFL